MHMKKVIAYCGFNSQTELPYVLLKQSFRELTEKQQIVVLQELIEELQFEMDFITGAQDTSTGPQQSAHQSVRPCEI
jgi:hypothetical protein